MIGKTIYDISEDEMRAATQEDVDNYAKAIMTGQFMVMVLRRLLPVVVPPPGPAFADQLRHNFKTWLRQQGEMSPDEINALPEHVRRYIHHIETDCDPSGTIRENFRLCEENAMLRAECERLFALTEEGRHAVL